MNWIESAFLQAIREIADSELEKETKRQKKEKGINYRKLPYIKINKIENVKHPESTKTEKQKQKEWRVRKENINKIKLPAFCSFQAPDGRPRRIGILVNDDFKGEPELGEGGISLYEIDKQTGMLIGDKIDGIVGSKHGIASLIDQYQINIGKAEINFYE